jgi:hypothetical protein
MENMTPGIWRVFGGVNAPGAMTERVKLDFGSQPQTIRLKRGRTLAGRVVQAGTGYAIPNTPVTAVDFDHPKLPMLRTQTDADGRFEFSTRWAKGTTRFPLGTGSWSPIKNSAPMGTPTWCSR